MGNENTKPASPEIVSVNIDELARHIFEIFHSYDMQYAASEKQIDEIKSGIRECALLTDLHSAQRLS